MSQVKLRVLRLAIAWLAALKLVLTIAPLIFAIINGAIIYPLYIINIVIIIIVLVSYCLALRPLGRKVHPFLRAFLLFGFAIFFLYFDIDSFIFSLDRYLCTGLRSSVWCYIARVRDIISIILGFMIVYEVTLTFKYRGKDGAINALPQETIVISPPPAQPLQQPYYQQQQQQGYYYPQLQQQQPAPLQQLNQQGHYGMYEMQGQLVPPYQQPYYQSPMQPQQHSNAAGHHLPPPQIPGSTITATPQPGTQPIAPYTSPGTTIAVSPVLPAEGYPMSSSGGSSPLPPRP